MSGKTWTGVCGREFFVHKKYALNYSGGWNFRLTNYSQVVQRKEASYCFAVFCKFKIVSKIKNINKRKNVKNVVLRYREIMVGWLLEKLSLLLNRFFLFWIMLGIEVKSGVVPEGKASQEEPGMWVQSHWIKSVLYPAFLWTLPVTGIIKILYHLS